MEEKKKSVMPAASLTLGIISIISALFWYITFPTGILAIIFGAKSAKKTGSVLSKVAIILGIIGLTVFAFIYVSIIFLMIIANM